MHSLGSLHRRSAGFARSSLPIGFGYDLVAEARAAVKRARAALTAHDRLRALLESQWRDAWAEAWVRPEGASRAQKRGGATRHRRAEDWRKVARKEDADLVGRGPRLGGHVQSKAREASTSNDDRAGHRPSPDDQDRRKNFGTDLGSPLLTSRAISLPVHQNLSLQTMEESLVDTNFSNAAAGGGLLDNYFDRKQLCRELKITPRTLSRWIRCGIAPPSTNLGLRRLYLRASVERWLRSREASGQPRKAAKRPRVGQS